MQHEDMQNIVTNFGPADELDQALITKRSMAQPQASETPWHAHQKGQLILALSGSVTSYVEQGMWLVPPLSAVWIPGNVAHRNVFGPLSDVCMVFIDAEHTALPKRVCTLSISPLVRELILHIATLPLSYEKHSTQERLVTVLIDQLEIAPQEAFDFALPKEPRLRNMAQRLWASPHDRRTLNDWAKELAVSERTLARMIREEVNLSFGQWRGQLHLIVALQQLAHNQSVQQIAERLGYESVSAFITFFKKQLGCTPKQYQQRRWEHIPQQMS